MNQLKHDLDKLVECGDIQSFKIEEEWYGDNSYYELLILVLPSGKQLKFVSPQNDHISEYIEF
jgi:hypothetical protein